MKGHISAVVAEKTYRSTEQNIGGLALLRMFYVGGVM